MPTQLTQNYKRGLASPQTICMSIHSEVRIFNHMVLFGCRLQDKPNPNGHGVIVFLKNIPSSAVLVTSQVKDGLKTCKGITSASPIIHAFDATPLENHHIISECPSLICEDILYLTQIFGNCSTAIAHSIIEFSSLSRVTNFFTIHLRSNYYKGFCFPTGIWMCFFWMSQNAEYFL